MIFFLDKQCKIYDVYTYNIVRTVAIVIKKKKIKRS